MSTPGGIDWVVKQAAMSDWVVTGTGLPGARVLWAGQDMPRTIGPGITMRLGPLSTVGAMWLDTEDNPLVVALTVTASSGTELLTSVAHGLTTGDGPVRVSSTGTVPGGLAVDTDYWVVRASADTFKLSASFIETGGGGIGNPVTTIDLTSNGTGTISVASTADTLRAGEEIVQLARGEVRVTLTLTCHAGVAVGTDMAVAILNRLVARQMFESQTSILNDANVSVVNVGKVHPVNGIKDGVMFEPRARMDVVLSMASEDSEFNTIIQHADVTDLTNGGTTRIPPT